MASGVVPRIGTPASSSGWASFSGVWPPNWTITPSSSPLDCLDGDQLQHVLGGQRLEVEPVGGVVVGGDGLGVAVDHDRLDADLVEREGRVAAAVVELDALADAVGAAAEDDRLLAVAWARPRTRAPGRARRSRRSSTCRASRRANSAGAGVDALEHRPHAQRAAHARAPRASVWPVSVASRASEKPMRLQPRAAPRGSAGRPSARSLRLLGDQGLDLAQEPGLVGAGARAISSTREAVAEGLGDHPQAIGRRHAQRAHAPRRGRSPDRRRRRSRSRRGR